MLMSCFICLQLMSLVISQCAWLLIWMFCPESSSLSFSHCVLMCEVNRILMHAFVMCQIPLWQTWWPLFMPSAQNTNCDALIGWSCSGDWQLLTTEVWKCWALFMSFAQNTNCDVLIGWSCSGVDICWQLMFESGKKHNCEHCHFYGV